MPLISIDNERLWMLRVMNLRLWKQIQKGKMMIEALEKRQKDYDRQQDFDQLLHNKEFRERFFGQSSSNGQLK